MRLTMYPTRRKAIYAFGIALAALLAVLGIVRAEVTPAILGVIYAGTNLLAVLNVDTDDDPADDELDGPRDNA